MLTKNCHCKQNVTVSGQTCINIYVKGVLPGHWEGVEIVPEEGEHGYGDCHAADGEAAVHEAVVLQVGQLVDQHILWVWEG